MPHTNFLSIWKTLPRPHLTRADVKVEVRRGWANLSASSEKRVDSYSYSLSIAKTYLSLAKVGAVLDAGRAESPATSRVFTASVGRNDTVAGRGERRSVARATKRPEQALVVARVREGVVELGLWLGHIGASPDLQCDTGGVGNSLAILTARGDWS